MQFLVLKRGGKMQFFGLKQGGKMQEDYNFISNLSKIQ